MIYQINEEKYSAKYMRNNNFTRELSSPFVMAILRIFNGE